MFYFNFTALEVNFPERNVRLVACKERGKSWEAGRRDCSGSVTVGNHLELVRSFPTLGLWETEWRWGFEWGTGWLTDFGVGAVFDVCEVA